MHDSLMRSLSREDVKKLSDPCKFGKFGTVKHPKNADYSKLETRVSLIAFLRLSAEIDRVMAELYKMTARLDLPIIAHASPEGFALDDDYYKFGKGSEWQSAMSAPGGPSTTQRILLTHTGGATKKKKNFFEDVARLLASSPNIFADLSAHDAKDWAWRKDKLKQVESSIVYGSDFWMTMRNADIDDFLHGHRRLFDEPNGYLRDNALNFLAPAGSGNQARICNYARGRLAPAIDSICAPPPAM